MLQNERLVTAGSNPLHYGEGGWHPADWGGTRTTSPCSVVPINIEDPFFGLAATKILVSYGRW